MLRWTERTQAQTQAPWKKSLTVYLENQSAEYIQGEGQSVQGSRGVCGTSTRLPHSSCSHSPSSSATHAFSHSTQTNRHSRRVRGQVQEIYVQGDTGQEHQLAKLENKH